MRRGESQTRVDGLAFHCEDTEYAFVDAMQRFSRNESFECFDTEGEFASSEGPLLAHATVAKTLEVVRREVIGPIDDAQVLRSPTFDSRLDEPTLAGHDRCERFDDHPFPTVAHKLLPPRDGGCLAFRIVQVHRDVPGGTDKPVPSGDQAIGD